jgi:hypothetical protein
LFATVIGDSVTFNWSPAADPEGGVAQYYLQVGTSEGGFDLFNGLVTGTSHAVTASFGTTVFARVQQVNHAGIYGEYSSSSAGVTALDPAADNDGDGFTNADEYGAATDPRDAGSFLRTIATRKVGADVQVDVASRPGRIYQLERKDTLEPGVWVAVGPQSAGTGGTLTLTDSGGATPGRRFYRVRVEVP